MDAGIVWQQDSQPKRLKICIWCEEEEELEKELEEEEEEEKESMCVIDQRELR